MNAILLSADQFFSSRVRGVAERIDVSLEVVSSADQVLASTGAEPVSLVLLDLATPDLVVGNLVESIRSSHRGAAIVAFGPHVHEGKLALAREAGCDSALSRGQFDRQMEEILRRSHGSE